MVVKTFRGALADASEERIRLSTIKGKVGYRIVKYEIISAEPFAKSGEHIVKLYKESQSTIDGVVDFTDSSLLGVALWRASANELYPLSTTIIFDREIFNQDIYITHADLQTSSTLASYYLELEIIPLDDAGAEYTTLKAIRTRTA